MFIEYTDVMQRVKVSSFLNVQLRKYMHVGCLTCFNENCFSHVFFYYYYFSSFFIIFFYLFIYLDLFCTAIYVVSNMYLTLERTALFQKLISKGILQIM